MDRSGDLNLANASAVCRAEDIGSFCRRRDSTRRDTREKSPSLVAVGRKLAQRERDLTARFSKRPKLSIERINRRVA